MNRICLTDLATNETPKPLLEKKCKSALTSYTNNAERDKALLFRIG